MKLKNKKMVMALFAAGLLFPGIGGAQTINLQQAIDMSLSADPRIKEREYLVESARQLLAEAKGNEGWRINANAFIGLAPAVDGGFYKNGAYSGTKPRRDGDEWNGLSDWTHLEFALIKPLYTFGKVDAYGKAAEGNVDIKRGDMRQSQAETVFDTKRAYYGYLTARDIRLFLEDMLSRLDSSIGRAERALKQETGEVTQAELYSLQATKGVIGKYVHQARAVETISLDGLRVLTGLGLKRRCQWPTTSSNPFHSRLWSWLTFRPGLCPTGPKCSNSKLDSRRAVPWLRPRRPTPCPTSMLAWWDPTAMLPSVTNWTTLTFLISSMAAV
jgi:outer membrane protein